jgi:hypothetical protein
VLNENVRVREYPITRHAEDTTHQHIWLGNGVDKLATISLYMTVKREDDGSNKDRVNITHWLGVENMQFGTSFLFMWLSWCFALDRTLPTVHRQGDEPCYVTDAQVQDYVVNGELLLRILKAFAYYTLLEMLHLFSLCV